MGLFNRPRKREGQIRKIPKHSGKIPTNQQNPKDQKFQEGVGGRRGLIRASFRHPFLLNSTVAMVQRKTQTVSLKQVLKSSTWEYQKEVEVQMHKSLKSTLDDLRERIAQLEATWDSNEKDEDGLTVDQMLEIEYLNSMTQEELHK